MVGLPCLAWSFRHWAKGSGRSDTVRKDVDEENLSDDTPGRSDTGRKDLDEENLSDDTLG